VSGKCVRFPPCGERAWDASEMRSLTRDAWDLAGLIVTQHFSQRCTHTCPTWAYSRTSANRALIWDPYGTFSQMYLILHPTLVPFASHMSAVIYFRPYWTHTPPIWAVKPHQVPTCYPYVKREKTCLDHISGPGEGATTEPTTSGTGCCPGTGPFSPVSIVRATAERVTG